MSHLTVPPMRAERKTSISSIRSREQLLEMDAAYFAHEMNTMRQRRTKIIATLCDTVASVDDIKEALGSGMNIIRTLEIIMKNKAIVEKEQGCFIPLLMDLKGNTMRLGSLDVPGGEVNLKKGEEFRISTNKKIKSNEHIVSCDCSELGKLVQAGDKLLVDYGKNVLIVKKIEKEGESNAYLKEKYPVKFEKGMLKSKLSLLKICSLGDYAHGASSNEDDNSEYSPKSNTSLDEKDDDIKDDKDDKDDKEDHPEREPHPLAMGKAISTLSDNPMRRKKFEYAFKKKKKVEKDVIVCEAESDCIIQSSKPIFIHAGSQPNSRVNKSKTYSLHSEDSDFDDEESCINVKDIKDLNTALKLEVDAVAITGVRSRKDIEEAKFILGSKSHIRIISKIQNAMALDNFDEILEGSDGIIISRNYLSLHIPVEKLFFKQKEMIRKCHTAGKPVTIVSQVLESMVRGMVPTSSEVNDIANLILDGIDGLTLVTETTYGLHRKESIETLSRICYEIEYNEILNKQKKIVGPENLQQIPTPFLGAGAHKKSINSDYIIPKIDPSALPSISTTIASCVIKAVYDLQASLIVSFTQTGSIVLKLSKMRSPCPIIAVTQSERIARQVSLLASVTAVKVGSMYGKEGLTQKVMAIAKEKNWVKNGDFIVVSFGDVEGVSGTTNSLKIVKVQ